VVRNFLTDLATASSNNKIIVPLKSIKTRATRQDALTLQGILHTEAIQLLIDQEICLDKHFWVEYHNNNNS
jgi:hypothetical protein